MLAHKIELFGVISIWISTAYAHKCQYEHNAERFKKKATFGIAIAGIVIAALPF